MLCPRESGDLVPVAADGVIASRRRGCRGGPFFLHLEQRRRRTDIRLVYASASPRVQAVSALAAGAIVALGVVALVFGLQVREALHSAGALISVSLESREPKPPEQPKPKPRPSTKSAPKGDPAPRNLRNEAAQVVVPPPRVVLRPPLPFPVATQQPGIGSAPQTGASDHLGPGQGAGGVGSGRGGGGRGGDGDGLGQPAKGPRQIRGKLSYSDLPDDLLQEGDEAAVGVRYTVDADGGVSQCLVDEPSRYRQLNALTCRLIEQRFRFRPARNRHGDAVPSQIVERHTWFRRPDD